MMYVQGEDNVQMRVSSVATRNGVIAGVILGLLSLPVITLSAVTRLRGAGAGLSLLFLIVALVVLAVAGFVASRRNGLLRSGVWAGFLGGLITAFILVCVGVVILTLLAPYALLAAGAARRAGRLAALAGRTAIARLIVSGLIVTLGGLIAGLIGGALGRIGRPGAASAAANVPGSGRMPPTVGDPGEPQARSYTTAPAQSFQQSFQQSYAMPQGPAGAYTPAPTPTPQPYYPPSAPYDSDAPTTVREPQD